MTGKFDRIILVRGNKRKYSQREYMRKMVKELGLDREKVCAAYVKAQREGLVRHKSNRNGVTPEEYAQSLWYDGFRTDRNRRPWLLEPERKTAD